MKNLLELKTLAECYSCNKNMFVCYTPLGADYNTCPLCTRGDFYNLCNEEENKKYFKKYYNVDDNIYEKYSFCKFCKIIYEVGCTHALEGCTENCYNAHLISKYKYKDEIYDGMPQFDSVDEWYNELNNIIILEWVCINNGLICKKALYPYSTHKELYGCNLQCKNIVEQTRFLEYKVNKILN